MKNCRRNAIAGVSLVTLLLGLLIGCNDDAKQTMDGGTDTEESTPCPWDEDDELSQAAPLSANTPTTGFLCPRGDQDWYSLTIPAGKDLIKVNLSIDSELVSPINPTYAVWDSKGTEVVGAPSASEAAEVSIPLLVTHGLAPNQYLLVVRDRGNDSEDVRHPYELTVAFETDPDSMETNNSKDTATSLTTGNAAKAYISYRGDEDWYKIESEAMGLLELSLDMPASEVSPSYRIIDPAGNELVTDQSTAKKGDPTGLDYLQSLTAAGEYLVVIKDNDNLDSDDGTPYTLTLSVQADPDSNEPNDKPDEATGLTELSCGQEWSEWQSLEGYISSSGDIDWYKIDLTGCSRGIIEAEVNFKGKNSLPDNLQAAIRLVREKPGQNCSVDQDCASLTLKCETDLDCSANGNTCLADGHCAGAGVCLPTDLCGATICALAAKETVEVNPERGTALLSAPLFNAKTVYLAVEDYHGDAQSISNAYTFRVRTLRDPDSHERSESYTAGPPQADDDPAAHTSFAKETTIYDCRPDAPGGPTCCGADTWTTGYLSYAFDQDWFKYSHPCPGNDCMVRINYEFGEGPIDYHMQVYQSDQLWFDTVLDIVEKDVQAATSGHFGGLEASDDCFYAYDDHVGPAASPDAGVEPEPFWYYLMIRDTVFVSEDQEEDGTWDWNSDQQYRICVETIASGCQEPCYEYEGDGGCGVPFEEE
jgi:hypothetical protein